MQEARGDSPKFESPQALEPAHPMGVAVLPTSDQPFPVTGSVSGAVRRVYPQALEFVDHAAAMGGYASSLGLLFLSMSMFLLYLGICF